MNKNSFYISSDSDDEPFSKLSTTNSNSNSNSGKIVMGKRTTMSEAIFGVKTRNNRYKVSDTYRSSTKGGKRKRKTVKRKTVKRRRR